MKKIFIVFFILLNQHSYSDLKIITAEEPPMNYIEDGEINGIVVDLVKEILKEQKVKAKIDFYPWARAYILSQQTPDCVIFTAAKTQERINQGFKFLGPVVSRRVYLYKCRDNQISASSLGELRDKGLIVGVMRGDWRSDFLKNKGIKTEEVANQEMNVIKLLNKRIPFIIISDFELLAIMKFRDIHTDSLQPALSIMENSSYLMFSKGTSKIEIDNWQKAFLILIKSGSMNRIADKWSKKLGTSIIWSDETGFRLK